MLSKKEWMEIIEGRGGKIRGGVVTADQMATSEFLGGSWFHRKPEDYEKKTIRDRTAREMRKDGWDVKTETNSLGYFLDGKRRRK